jgi:uracil-DNA glycosylase
MHPHARVLIAGQAPGRRVHASGVPFDDASGDRLREWMGIPREVFYDAEQVAILPMAFCFPGTGKSGDLPPRPECAAMWRERLLVYLPSVEVALLVGRYAQAYHLQREAPLTETVRAWRAHWPGIVPLPHPSPRNNLWLSRNPWFEKELLPELPGRIAGALGRSSTPREHGAGRIIRANPSGVNELATPAWRRTPPGASEP